MNEALRSAKNPSVMRRIACVIFNKKAVSHVVSVTILTGAVIALSLAVFSWSQSRSAQYNEELSETFDEGMARLKEKLVFEYVSYCNPSEEITVYLLNCGLIDDVEIANVYVSSDSWAQVSPNPILHFMNGSEIPDQDLDVAEEGYLVLELSTILSSGNYVVKVVTERGALFVSNFVV